MSEIENARNKLISEIKQGKNRESLSVAKCTANFLQLLVSKTEWNLAREILDAVATEGRLLTEALPLEATVSNVVLQLLHVIREEYRTAITKTRPAVQAVQRFLEGPGGLRLEEERYTVPIEGLKEAVIDHVAEYQTELELSAHNISQQASKHIQPGDIVMTIGRSAMVEALLLAKVEEEKPRFEVIVVEGAPFCEGHKLAAKLASRGISTTLVPDSSMFALMPRVTKVVLGTSLVLGDGGLRAICGSHTMALAAKYHSVPVLVLAPSYKFTRDNSSSCCDLDVSPQGVLSFSQGDVASSVRVYNPVYDYVPPQYVTVLISNTGACDSSSTYLLLRELYGPAEESTADLIPS